ncbi:MAG: class I SAM-dependent methyltransferase [Proteobacteria bacterium]|nr:class I SAM-dependent methyltransferase [Pseudomonadota bacterium]
MKQDQIEAFWDANCCGQDLVGRPNDEMFEDFFKRYDEYRYRWEHHIPRCLDELNLAGKRVLEIGLGQGADSELLIRRGASWTGVDLTSESVKRVRIRLEVRRLPFDDIVKGSVLNLPFADSQFDLVFSHGVLHHVPNILRAQEEIHRVLKPNGELVVMLYSKRSLNYLVSIAILRRMGLLTMATLGIEGRGIYAKHLAQAKKMGLRRYLKLSGFVSRNTDGPENPYSKVYSSKDIEEDFPLFRIERLHRECMHAPPLPVQNLPGASLLGWHLWAHLRPT